MVQKVELSDEQKKEQQRQNCLDETKLRLMLAKCKDSKNCQNLSNMSHRLIGTKAKDFLPTGKVCTLTGSKGALLLESEREEYEKNYCKIDPVHKICKQEEDEDEEPKENAVVAESMASTTQSSVNGSAGLILLSSSSCCCLLMMVGGLAMMRMRRR
jgi:hypothetical protein